VERKGS